MKVSISVDELCDGLPKEFSMFLEYCRELKFDDRPDYSYCRHLFKNLFYKLGYEYDFLYDWVIFEMQAKLLS